MIMSQPHILMIPAWFDVTHQREYAMLGQKLATDISESGEMKMGILYGEFGIKTFKRKIFRRDDLPYHFLGVSGWSLPKIGWGWKIWKRQYLKAFEQYMDYYGKPDVIHAYSLLGLIAAGRIHRKYNIPIIYTEVLGAFISGDVSPRLVRAAKNTMDLIVEANAESEGMIEALSLRFGIKARLLPMYISTDYFKPAFCKSPELTIISIGSPAYKKGLDILIRAFALVVKTYPEARLILVDEIPDKEVIDPLIERFELKDHITFVGIVPYDEIPDLLNQSDILVSASRVETLGNTMIEALACGIPVVATETPGSRFVLSPETGRIVPQEDFKKMAQELIEVYQKIEEFPPNQLHDYANSRFDKQVVLPQWIALYKDVINKS